MHPCLGCGHCGMDGECVQKDDNIIIKETLLESDMVVFVTPIYYFGMSAFGNLKFITSNKGGAEHIQTSLLYAISSEVRCSNKNIK